MWIDYLTGPWMLLITLAIAVPSYWFIILLLNKSTKTPWSDTKREIYEEGNVAVAVRAGLMYIAVALLVVGGIGAGASNIGF